MRVPVVKDTVLTTKLETALVCIHIGPNMFYDSSAAYIKPTSVYFIGTFFQFTFSLHFRCR